ncbi:zinc-binding alcohol dehydrogenase family protein [Mycolicibacterium goodii]|uniref:Zinc-type alcohol dehydrogenase-like protein n=1 Tax=Mycolicibacterium goodii TaxID=134601 RepID=A0ABS6HM64_MYCGD|nr:zinc-binding alcohol dehydrogenase family protein [Mycolicibacterium goodii]OKH63740.1 NADPH:quinone reductase [Mycobacterium sp. SWH-M5]MBU8823308.1 zinc-binding alcohol dehydrogenase family protein [Mycolicibacterium goodii]MBU8835644.1 zinc-binding alcohol dehydrogenase family protein [Mycolicibacterium goodii]PJK20704.1 zinc-binding alcohol dehydrogenase family protein [Mycolicibacterium goodii]ULN46298.1 zinc-binding alcohol dehydrogenase family protein [Mycolicibacterium goodii]
MPTMTAVAAFAALPIDDPDSLQDITIDVPELRPHDVLVRVEAVSVNPVDIKRRRSLPPSTEPTILGFDAAGVVEAVGDDVTTLAVGDEVWYAGDISRPGTDAQLHAVDERIVSRKPRSLSFRDAAAMPLTTITAWETLFERFGLTAGSQGDLLVLGAAGGVGSVMIQLAKKLTGVRVIATASRDESRQWVRDLGADEVIDHHELRAQALDVAPDGVDYLFSPHSAGNVEIYADIVRPFGHITAIDEPEGLDLVGLKTKSIAWHWELMFTRPLTGYDIAGQQRLLAAAADLVDRGELRTTLTTAIDGFEAKSLREAHRLVESGRMVGKVVVCR